MTTRTRTILSLVLALCLAWPLYAAPPQVNGVASLEINGVATEEINGVSGAAPPPSYLLTETFDGATACGDGSHTNCDTTWTVTGSPNFDGAGLTGTYATDIGDGSVTQIITSGAFSAKSELWMTWRGSITVSGGSTQSLLGTISNSTITLCKFQVRDFGGSNRYWICTAYAGSDVSNTSGPTYIENRYYKLYSKSSTGANDGSCTLSYSADGYTNWTQICTSTNGTSTQTMDRVALRSTLSAWRWTVDQIKVDDVDISDAR